MGEGRNRADPGENGQRADAERDGRRGDGAKHDQQDEERQRQADQLSAQQIMREERVEIGAEGEVAGERHVEQIGADPLAQLGVVPGGDRKIVAQRHHRQAAVGRG